jgi:hypothetical protein
VTTDLLLFAVLLAIAALSALAGSLVAHARLRRALRLGDAPFDGSVVAIPIPIAGADLSRGGGLRRRRAHLRHEYDLMIGRTFFH